MTSRRFIEHEVSSGSESERASRETLANEQDPEKENLSDQKMRYLLL